MIKKIKDLTLLECKKICEDNECCRECPLYNICTLCACDYDKEDLEKEIEVEEND